MNDGENLRSAPPQPPFAVLMDAAALVLRRASEIEPPETSPRALAAEWQAFFGAARAALSPPAAESEVVSTLGMKTLAGRHELLAEQSTSAQSVARTLAAATVDLWTGGALGPAAALCSLVTSMSGDDTLPAVLPFFVCLEALVRSRQGQDGNGTVVAGGSDFWRVAVEQARLATRPVLVLCGGLSGSGKSFVANGVASALGARVFASDMVRKRLTGMPLTERVPAHLNKDVYSQKLTEQVFSALNEGAETELRAGFPVVLDATYLTARRRALPLLTAQMLDVPAIILWCRLAERVAIERLGARSLQAWTVSDADARIRRLQRHAVWEQPRDGEGSAVVINVDTASAPALVFSRLLRRIERLLRVR